MLIDSPQIAEGSKIKNATVDSGTAFPAQPNAGELFYRTDLEVLYVYNDQATAWAEAGSTGLDAHIADQTLHLTSAQNTLLDGLASTLTSTELNYVDGVTSPIQTQLNTTASALSTHISDQTLHITSAQNTLLDGLASTLTSTELNYVDGVTSPIQTQLDSITSASSSLTTRVSTLESTTVPAVQTNLDNHISDATVHVTSAEHTWLTGVVETNGITVAEVQKLSGASGLTGTIKQNIDNLSTGKVSIDGTSTMTGNLNLGGNRITAVGTPQTATDAVNRDYVDQLQQGIFWKTPVVVATTANITLSGLQTIDGITLSAGDRVLVKNQTTASENGFWDAAAGAWTRSADAAAGSSLSSAAVFVRKGTTFGDTAWVCTSDAAVAGTDALVFVQFSAAGGLTAGSGITVAGSTVSANIGNGLTFSSNAIVVNPKVGSLAFSSGQLDLTSISQAASGNFVKVTLDGYGRVTGNTAVTASDISGLVDSRYVLKAGDTMTGALTISTGYESLNLLSGVATTPVAMVLGRTATDAKIGVAANAGDWIGSSSVGDLVISSLTGNIIFAEGTTTPLVFFSKNQGKVGITQTPSNWYSNGATTAIQLKRGSVASLGGGPNDHIAIASNAYSTTSNDPASAVWNRVLTGTATLYEAGRGGKHQWSISTSDVADSAITWNPVLTIDATGNLVGTAFRALQGVPNNGNSSTNGYGFGTDGDTGLFAVGTTNASTSVNLFLNNTNILSAAAAAVTIGFGSPKVIINSAATGTGTSTTIVQNELYVNGAVSALTSGTGSASFNNFATTNNSVYGTTNLDDAQLLAVSNTNVSTTAGSVANDSRVLSFGGYTNGMGFIRNAAGTGMLFAVSNIERMRIDSVGNVGIGSDGTLSGVKVLIVPDSNSTGLRIQTSDATANASTSIVMTTAGTDTRSIQLKAIGTGSGAGNGHSFAIYTSDNGANASERMRVLYTGLVGIGTSAPGAMLTVNSTTAATSTGTGEATLQLVSSTPATIPATLSGSSVGTLSLMGGGMNTGSFRGGQIDLIAGQASSSPGCIVFRPGITANGGINPETARFNASKQLLIGTSSGSMYDTNAGSDVGATFYSTLISGLGSSANGLTISNSSTETDLGWWRNNSASKPIRGLVIRSAWSSTTAGSEAVSMLFSTMNAGVLAERMILSNTGNLAVGTSTLRSRITASGGISAMVGSGSDTADTARALWVTADNTTYNGFAFQLSASNNMWVMMGNGSNAWNKPLYLDYNGTMLLGNGASATPSSGGVALIPNNGGAGNSQVNIGHISGSGTGSGYLAFYYDSSPIGSISQSGTTAVAYNTSSDYRLKTNVAPMSGALTRIANLKPVTYNWIADNLPGEGFIAHELAEVCPQAVTGEKDAVDTNGNPIYQGIDTSFLVGLLTAGIQEQQAIIDEQRTTIANLQTTLADVLARLSALEAK